MKKWFVILLCLTLLLPGCAAKPEAETTETTSQTPSSETTAPTQETQVTLEEKYGLEEAELEAAQEALDAFFMTFEESDFARMRQKCTDQASRFVEDGSYLGYSSAEMLRAELLDLTTPQEIFFLVYAKVATPDGKMDVGQEERTFMIGLVKEDGIWKVSYGEEVY